jgi:hypothetical protein
MDNSYSANIKVCGTCSFGMGERTTDTTRTRAKYETGSRGDCHEGGLKKTGKMNNAQCLKWQKWGGLR